MNKYIVKNDIVYRISVKMIIKKIIVVQILISFLKKITSIPK